MSTPARIICLISPNGLGHYRRSIGLLDRLRERVPAQISVVCEDSQVERAAYWERSRRFWQSAGVTRISGVLLGVQWPLAVDGNLLGWVARLAEVNELAAADLVLSDNLGGVLAVRPDAILIGSFLWSDVLASAYPNHAPVRAFVEHERALLAKHRPPMLCVGDIVMPGVVERTEAVRLPWFCEDQPVEKRHSNSRARIAVIGGATGAADALLTRVASVLATRPNWDIASAPHLGAPHAFGFTPGEFAALDLVVGRPGIGTITDCVAQRVPMVVLHEPTANAELTHNGQRLAKLGFARDLGSDPPDADVLRAVDEMLDGVVSARIRERLAAAECDGLARAVDYLETRLTQVGA